MARQSVFEMPFEKVYQCLVQKAERKGRTQAEVDQVVKWLTGYVSKKMRQLDKLIDELAKGKPMESVLR